MLVVQFENFVQNHESTKHRMKKLIGTDEINQVKKHAYFRAEKSVPRLDRREKLCELTYQKTSEMESRYPHMIKNARTV